MFALKPGNGAASTPPATSRSAMSVTSSNSRRPFGKPAGSPPSSPRRFADAGGVGGNAGVQPQQIGDRPGGVPGRRSAARRCTTGSRSSARRRRNRDGPRGQRVDDARQRRIEEEGRELAVVLRLVHAEAVLEAGADQQLVDQRIAHALHLAEACRELTAGSGARRTVVRGRDVVPQTPIVAAVEVAGSIAARSASASRPAPRSRSS